MDLLVSTYGTFSSFSEHSVSSFVSSPTTTLIKVSRGVRIPAVGTAIVVDSVVLGEFYFVGSPGGRSCCVTTGSLPSHLECFPVVVTLPVAPTGAPVPAGVTGGVDTVSLCFAVSFMLDIFVVISITAQ